MEGFGRWRLLTLFLAAAFPAAPPARGDGDAFRPVRAVVTGKGDLADPKGVLATIRVEVPERQRYSELGSFEKGGRVDLEITAGTRVEILAGGKRTPAGVGALVKGCAIEFRDFDEVLLSNPAVVRPRVVLITAPAK